MKLKSNIGVPLSDDNKGYAHSVGRKSNVLRISEPYRKLSTMPTTRGTSTLNRTTTTRTTLIWQFLFTIVTSTIKREERWDI